MTTIDPQLTAAGSRAEPSAGALARIGEWLTTSDHKRVGVSFVALSLLFALATAVIGALLGIERMDATTDLVDSGAMPQLFAFYRVMLTFGVLAPLGLGLAVAIVPLQLGARSLAFSRAAQGGFWAWALGMVLVVVTLVANGGPGGGDATMVELFLLAHLVAVLGLVVTAGAVATSVLTTRAPGMTMRRVPMFSWASLIGALGMLLVLPVLVAVLVLLAIDYRYGRSTFGAEWGILDWAGFAFTQPTTLVYAVPVFGLLLDAVATATRRRLPQRMVAYTGLGLAGLGLLAGVTVLGESLPQNVLRQDLNPFVGDVLPVALLHALPLLGPVVVLGVVGLALKAGRPKVLAAWVGALLAALLVLLGIAANVLYQVGDARVQGTVFEEGAWLAVSYGALLGALAGLAHWAPKLWGRRLPDVKVIPVFLLAALGTLLAAAPMLIAGFADQPAGITLFDYDGPQSLWNTLSAIGHLLTLLAVVAFVGLLVATVRSTEPAGDDPFDGQTLEWATSSPAPADNFAAVPTVTSAEPLLDLKPAATEGNA